MWVNAKGERFWVKYHFMTDQGIDFLTQEEADRIAGVDADYHRRDLFEAIKRGDYPSWTLKMQIMPFEEAKTYRFNPFDLTKVWPHGDYPLHEVGRLTLNVTRPTSTPRSSRPRSNRTTSFQGSVSARTKCCSPVSSLTLMPIGPALGSTTNRFQ